jgi:site-specific DNA-methyltransferase (adenine-specific)
MILHNADCLDVMRDMAANSVDAIITDPPYYKVKGEAWDNQWDTPAKFLAWVGLLCEQFERILKPNGSLYFFASPQMAARVECEIGKRFAVLNSITWRKGAESKSSVGWSQKTEKEALRLWLPTTERIIFAEHYGADNMAKGEAGYEAKCDELRGFVFEPLLAWFVAEWEKSGLTRAQVDEACGCSNVTQYWFLERNYQIPTVERYSVIQRLAPDYFRREYEDLRREYEDLRREYEDLRREYEDLRRPFSVTARDQWSDVWDFEPVKAYPGKHPCEKPLPLLCHILNASTKPGAVVFDPFAGSASLGEACHDLGRQFIGVELCPDNYAKAAQRIAAVKAQERLFV